MTNEEIALLGAYGTAVGALFTGVGVILTGVYVYFTYKLLRSGQELFKEQTRPQVIARIASFDSYTRLFIENIGNGIAQNVKVEISPSLETLQMKKIENPRSYEPMLEQAFLTSKQSVTTIINKTENIMRSEVDYPKIFEVSIQYQDMQSNHYKHNYTINIASYIYPKMVSNITEKQYLKEITIHFESTSKVLKDIVWELRSIRQKLQDDEGDDTEDVE